MRLMQRRSTNPPRLLGVLPGAFHPPTRAHLELARAALGEVDEVLFVLPRAFPHKQYEPPGLGERVRMLELATAAEPRFSIGISEGGLFIDIARECRGLYGAEIEPWFLCGRDAAERIAGWDYGRQGAFEDMLSEFGLLVAPRQGEYVSASERIRPLAIPGGLDELSSTEVRRRIARNEAWEDLVPEEIRELVRSLYVKADPTR